MKNIKFDLKELPRNLNNGNDYVFIFGVGFDQRCLIIPEVIVKNLTNIKESIGVLNYTWKHKAAKNKEALQKLFLQKLNLIEDEDEKIINVADKFISAIKPFKEDNNVRILIDITAFSHELLAVVLGILNAEDLLFKVDILYTGASNYGKWLSEGVIDVRSILGFPGTMLPSKKIHLILMTGFEVHRAIDVFRWYEPASVAIGKGKKEESISDEHSQKNDEAHGQVSLFINKLHEADCTYSEFEFSCTDPLKTKEQLLSLVKKADSFNIVICPLNNKISTIGAILAALENDNIQLCYSQPAEYNVENYVEPSSEVRLISF